MLAHKISYDTLSTNDLPERGSPEWYLHKRARKMGRAVGGGKIAKFREITRHKGIGIRQVVADELPRLFDSEYYFYLWNVGPLLCHYCGVRLHRSNRTRDHVVPRSSGGSDLGRGNLIPACRDCNWEKADTPLLKWLVERKEKIR